MILLVSSMGFSQQCYIDGALLASDGERGKAVAYIFSYDLKYGANIMADYNDWSIEALDWVNDETLDGEFKKDGEYIVTKQGTGFWFSSMVKNECNKDDVIFFNSLLEKYLKTK